MVPAEGTFPVQVFAEECVSCPEALIEGGGEGSVPVLLEPVVPVEIGICLHVVDETLLFVFVRQIFPVRRLVAPVGSESGELRGVAHDDGAGEIHRVNGVVSVDVGHVQIPNPVHVHLVVDVQHQPLHNFQSLSAFGKEHVVGQGTGKRGHHVCPANAEDHLIQWQRLRVEKGIAVSCEKVVQQIPAALEKAGLFQSAPAEINLLIGLPARIYRDIFRHGVENLQ